MPLDAKSAAAYAFFTGNRQQAAAILAQAQTQPNLTVTMTAPATTPAVAPAVAPPVPVTATSTVKAAAVVPTVPTIPTAPASTMHVDSFQRTLAQPIAPVTVPVRVTSPALPTPTSTARPVVTPIGSQMSAQATRINTQMNQAATTINQAVPQLQQQINGVATSINQIGQSLGGIFNHK